MSNLLLAIAPWLDAAPSDSVWVTGLVTDLDPAEATLDQTLSVTDGGLWLDDQTVTVQRLDRGGGLVQTTEVVDVALTPLSVVLYEVVDATGATEVHADVLVDVEVTDSGGAPLSGELSFPLGDLAEGSEMTIPGLILNGIEPDEIDIG